MRRSYPELPHRIAAPGGDVRVALLLTVEDEEGGSCDGTWHEATRTIEVDGSAEPRHQWKSYFHEHGHVALDDAGLSQLLSEKMIEALCEAYATARMRERFG